jgi:hypothetical protein
MAETFVARRKMGQQSTDAMRVMPQEWRQAFAFAPTWQAAEQPEKIHPGEIGEGYSK